MSDFEISRENKELSPTVFSLVEKPVFLPEIWQSRRWLVPLSGLFISLFLFTLFAVGETGIFPSLPEEKIQNLALVGQAFKTETLHLGNEIYDPVVKDFYQSLLVAEEIGKAPQSLVSGVLAKEDNFYNYFKESARSLFNQSINSWSEIFRSLDSKKKTAYQFIQSKSSAFGEEFNIFKTTWSDSLAVISGRLKTDGSRLSAQISVGLSRLARIENIFSKVLPKNLPAFSYSLRETAMKWSKELISAGQSYNKNLSNLFASFLSGMKKIGSTFEQGRSSFREEIIYASEGVWSRMTQYQTKAVANWKNFLGTDRTINIESLPPEMREQIRKEIETEVKKNLSGAGLSADNPGAWSMPQEGVVVVPSTGSSSDEALRKKIQSLFSDQVEVKFDKSGKTGIITPVFKEGRGDNYLFMMTPIK